jgi:hypothetical protein
MLAIGGHQPQLLLFGAADPVAVQLVEPHLAARLAAMADLPLPQLVRDGTEQLLRLSQLEGQLLEQLFGAAVSAAAAPRPVPAAGVAVAGKRCHLDCCSLLTGWQLKLSTVC